MEKSLPQLQAIREDLVGRGNELRIPRATTANPILTGPEFTRLLRAPTSGREKDTVDFLDEP